MDHIILLAMWQSASRAGLLPCLVGYSGEKHIPRFVQEFYGILCEYRLYVVPLHQPLLNWVKMNQLQSDWTALPVAAEQILV